MADHFCEESCGIASAAACSKWRECYKDHPAHVKAEIEKAAQKNKEESQAAE